MSEEKREGELDWASAPAETEGAAAPEPAAAAGTGAPAGEGPRTKACVFCLSEIDALAIRCNRCAGYLPPAEGTDFKQHWSMLFACTAIFLAAVFMPIEGALLDLHAVHGIAGAFLAVFAGYGVVAGLANIFHRKMIMWPALFAALDGLYIVVSRGTQILQNRMPEDPDPRAVIHLFGSGFYVILFASLLIVWTLFTGVLAGAKREAERKEAAKAARKQR